MRKWSGALSLMIYCLSLSAQTGQQLRDQRVNHQDVTRTGSNSDYNKEVVDRAPANQSLIDRNKYGDPALKNLKVPAGTTALTNRLHLYPVALLSQQTNLSGITKLPDIQDIRLIDVRFDTGKLGFLPLTRDLQQQGYNTIGFAFNSNLKQWMEKNFLEKYFVTDTSAKSHLLLVMRKYWFSQSAAAHYTVANPPLETVLFYHFELYSTHDFGYYPQKKIEGSFTAAYNKGDAFRLLTDSILGLLRSEIQGLRVAAKETELNWQSPVDFNHYYNTRKRQLRLDDLPKGVYASYTDFLERRPMSDSVDIVTKYTNYERVPLYACRLSAFKEGVHIATNKCWGYFDGSFIFLNTGEGLFIKLTPSKGDHVFFHLKNLEEERIKRDMLEMMVIAGTPYRVLRDYTKTYGLTYQLDPETGRLY